MERIQLLSIKFNENLRDQMHSCMHVSYTGKTEKICGWFPVIKNTGDKTPPVSER